MQTKHYIFFVGIVLSILLSMICGFLAIQTFNLNEGEFSIASGAYLLISWILGGIVFYVIKTFVFDNETNQ